MNPTQSPESVFWESVIRSGLEWISSRGKVFADSNLAAIG